MNGGWPYKYFKPEEFACKCCGEMNINLDLVKILDEIREELKFPFIILSGYRCPKHNQEIGSSDDSAHPKGNATDIKIMASMKRYLFLRLAIKKFKRIGIYKTFIHVDIDPDLPQPVMWVG